MEGSFDDALQADFLDLPDPTKSPAVVHILSRKELMTSRDLPFHDMGEMEVVEQLSNRQRFTKRFFNMVVRTLNEACEAEAGSKRNQILADLVGNLSAPIEGHVIAYFLRDASIRDGQAFGNRFYFELAAAGFGENIQLFDQFNMDYIVSVLRSNDTHFHSIFAMLFHMWIFQSGEADVKSLNLFLSGAEFLFRKDLEEIDNENAANHFVFRSIYQTLRKVLANHLLWSESAKSVLMDLWSLFCRFCFFYEKKPSFVIYNFKQFQLQRLLTDAKDQNKILVLKSGDMSVDLNLSSLFVQHLLRQLLIVKSSRVFSRFMQFTGVVFSKIDLSPHSAVLLQSELYSRSKPGNPYYLPDDCRRAAQLALATAFPRGHLPRRAVALLFRLLQPWYTVRHLLAMLYLLILRVCCCCCIANRRNKSE